MMGFCDELRSERERRGMTLERVHLETKVHPRHLEALEGGNFQELPGGVFRRGIVRAYLNSLGLDDQIWMPRFEASLAEYTRSASAASAEEEESWAAFAANVKKNRPARGAHDQARWLGVGVLLLIFLTAAVAAWHYLLRSNF